MGFLDIFKKKEGGSVPKQHPLAEKIADFPVENLRIKDENGIVTISGQIEDGANLERIGEILKKEPGVRRLIQEVEVKDISNQNLRYAVKTKVRFLNARSGPSTDGKIVGKFPKDSEVLLIKKINKNWYLVKSDKLEGFCNTDYLKPLS